MFIRLGGFASDLNGMFAKFKSRVGRDPDHSEKVTMDFKLRHGDSVEGILFIMGAGAHLDVGAPTIKVPIVTLPSTSPSLTGSTNDEIIFLRGERNKRDIIINEQQTRINNFTEQVARLKSKRDEAVTQAQALTAQLANLHNEVNNRNAMVNDQQTRINNFTEQVARLKSKRDEAVAQVQALELDKSALQSRIDDREARVDNLKRVRDEIAAKLSEQEQVNIEQIEAYNNLQVELGQALVDIDNLDLKRQEKNEKIRHLTAEIENQKTQLLEFSNQQADVDALQLKLDDSENEIQALRASVDELTNRLQSCSSESELDDIQNTSNAVSDIVQNTNGLGFDIEDGLNEAGIGKDMGNMPVLILALGGVGLLLAYSSSKDTKKGR